MNLCRPLRGFFILIQLLQSVHHISEHVSTMSPVYTPPFQGLRKLQSILLSIRFHFHLILNNKINQRPRRTLSLLENLPLFA
jgi:hypothetical protein